MVILYVDDDQDDRELFCEAVKHIDPSYTIIEAKDGHDAIHIVHHVDRQIPDMIFLDINMPLLDGFETLAELKKNRRLINTEFVIYSTAIKASIPERYKNLGVFYLQKGNTMKDSINRIRSVIQKS